MYVDIFISLIFQTKKQPPNETIIKKTNVKNIFEHISLFLFAYARQFWFLVCALASAAFKCCHTRHNKSNQRKFNTVMQLKLHFLLPLICSFLFNFNFPFSFWWDEEIFRWSYVNLLHCKNGTRRKKQNKNIYFVLSTYIQHLFFTFNLYNAHELGCISNYVNK